MDGASNSHMGTTNRVQLESCTRASTEYGPDYCVTCSGMLDEWVPWEGHYGLVNTVVSLRREVDRLNAALEELENE